MQHCYVCHYVMLLNILTTSGLLILINRIDMISYDNSSVALGGQKNSYNTYNIVSLLSD